MSRAQEILARIPSGRPSSDKLRLAASACCDLAEGLRSKAAQIAKDPALTSVGRKQALHEYVTKTYLPSLKQAQAPIGDAAAKLKQRRETIKIAAPDRGDVAGALERQEMRAMLRNMTVSQRQSFLLLNTDERFADAVLSVPPAMSGIDDRVYQSVLDATRARRFGDQMADIASEEEVIDGANVAYVVAQNEAQGLTEVNDREFARMIESSPGEVPWLKRQGDKVVKIVPGSIIAAPASADEIARGKYYSNADEWKSDNPVAHALWQSTMALEDAQKVGA